MSRTLHPILCTLSLLLAVGTVTVTNAQQNSSVWQRTIEDYPNNIQMSTTPDGSVGIICNNTGVPRPLELTKLDANGNLLWKSPIRGSKPDPSVSYIAQLYLLTATRDGGFVILCRETLNGSYRRYVLVKFTGSGEQIWLEPLADYYEEYQSGVVVYKAIIAESDGGILIAGGITYTRSYSPFVKKYTSLGKYDRDLTVGEASSISRAPSEIGITEIVETNTGYVVSGDYRPTIFGPSAGTVRFISKEGVLTNTINFPSELGITDTDFDPTDNSLVATSRNSQGWGILKFNYAGEVQFSSIIPCKTNEKAAYIKVATNPCEGYFVADTDSTNNTNFRITHIGRDGSILGAQIYGGQQSEYLRGLALQPNGNIVLAGITQSVDGDLTARSLSLPVPTNPVGWILSVNYLTMGGQLASVLTGNWNIPTTWNCGRIPGTTDAIQISTGHVVNLNQPATAKKLVIQGTLQV